VHAAADRRRRRRHPTGEDLDAAAMVTLQHAMRRAIQIVYQLEESELLAELLPRRDEPRSILFYEAAEGGAGVLNQVGADAAALQRVARLLDEAHVRARDIVQMHRATLDALADALIERETLLDEDLALLFAGISPT
jgi:ATP-dependent Zn protease